MAAGTSELEVSLSDAETVICLAHDIDALAGVLTQLVVGDEDAVALVGTPSDTSAMASV